MGAETCEGPGPSVAEGAAGAETWEEQRGGGGRGLGGRGLAETVATAGSRFPRK